MKYHDIKRVAPKKRRLTNEERLNLKGIPSFRQMCDPLQVADIVNDK